MYPIQQGQQLLNKTNGNNEQEIVPSDYLTLFPIELIVQIFQELTKFKDFCSFNLTSKFFYQIGSQNPQAVNCPELLPYSFAYHANSFLRQLPVWKKIKLATQIEKNLVSSETPQSILQNEALLIDKEVFNTDINTLIIDDYLILTSESFQETQGTIYLYHLTTGARHSFQAGDSKISLCMAIHTPSPLLVSVHKPGLPIEGGHENGFKIWNFNLLKSQNPEQALLFQKNDSIAHSCFNHTSNHLNDYSPIMAVSNHLLGVGYLNHVLIFDCNHLSEPPLHIAFENVKQIEFFDDHLMLVSQTQVAIWSDSAVLNALKQNAEEKILTLESATFNYAFKPRYGSRRNLITIAFGKVHQEKLVLAYQNGYVTRYQKSEEGNFQIGEILNWKTGQILRPLAHKCGLRRTSEFQSMDFQGKFLFTASHFLCKWDLDDIKNPCEDSIDSRYCLESRAFKVYSIGTHILFIYNRFVVIKEAKDFSKRIRKTGTLLLDMKSPYYYNFNPEILTFDLKGKYLITLIKNEKINEEDPEPTPLLTVYDLSQTADQMEQKT